MSNISAILRADACGLGTLSRMFHDFLPGGLYRSVSLARHEGGAWPEWFGGQHHLSAQPAGRGESGEESCWLRQRGEEKVESGAADCAHRHAPDGLTPELVDWLCDGADALVTFETWYGEGVPLRAKRRGVRTVLVPMYECCPQTGGGLEATDLVVCPTMLDYVEMTDNTPGLATAKKTLLPVPCDTRRIAFRQRERAEVFVHNAGHGGVLARNSTQAVLDAWQFVESPARLVVRMQPGMSVPPRVPSDSRITAMEMNVENYWDSWAEEFQVPGSAAAREFRVPSFRFQVAAESPPCQPGTWNPEPGTTAQRAELMRGDVLLHPTRFDALSLPIQEALTSGMPVMATRYWPLVDEFQVSRFKFQVEDGDPGRNLEPGTWNLKPGSLPASSQALAIAPTATLRQRVCREFTSHITSAKSIAAAVDALFGEDISAASLEARAWAEARSWEVLGARWKETLIGPKSEGPRSKVGSR